MAMSAWKENERKLNERYKAGQHRVFWESKVLAGIDKHGKPVYHSRTYRKGA